MRRIDVRYASARRCRAGKTFASLSDKLNHMGQSKLKGRDCGGFNLRVCLATFSLRQTTVPAGQTLDLRVGVALTISLIVKVKDTT